MLGTILIIEDNEDIAAPLADAFQARGYRVLQARDGSEGFAVVRLEGVRPDVILLDLLMPLMNGFEFLIARGAEPLLADCPVVVMSAQPSEFDGIAGETYERLLKPTPLAAVIDAVQRACAA